MSELSTLGGSERYGACDDAKIGNRIVVPKGNFIEWVARHTNGGAG